MGGWETIRDALRLPDGVLLGGQLLQRRRDTVLHGSLALGH